MMIPADVFLDLLIPFLALIVSALSLASATRFRSLGNALKYFDVCAAHENDFDGGDFEKELSREAKLIADYYYWRSAAYVTTHRRTYFNYASILIYCFGWIGGGLVAVMRAYTAESAIPISYPIGCVVLGITAALTIYGRYESGVLSKYFKMRENGIYRNGFYSLAAVRHEISDSSYFPIFGSFFLSMVASYYLEPAMLNALWSIFAVIAAVGNQMAADRVPSRFLRTLRQPHRPAFRCVYSSSSVTSR